MLTSVFLERKKMKVKMYKYKARIWDYHGHADNYEFEAPNDYEAYQMMKEEFFDWYGHDGVLWRADDDGNVMYEVDTEHIKPMEI